MIRFLAATILLISILFLPIGVSVIFALAGMAYFDFFLEAVFLFFLSDLLYGVKEARLFNLVFVSLIAALISFIIIELLKKKLRLNRQ